MRALWEHAFGEAAGILAVFSGERPQPESKQLDDPRTLYFDYPRETRRAEELCRRLCAEGREVYQCAHLLTARRRVKRRAASLTACYVDGDGAKPTANMPRPSAIVASSPGREQYWWRLSRPAEPEEAKTSTGGSRTLWPRTSRGGISPSCSGFLAPVTVNTWMLRLSSWHTFSQD